MADSKDSGERKAVGAFSADRLLQTVGGILLTVCLGLTTWTLKNVTELMTRISVLEARRDGDDKALQELKDGLKASLVKIEHQLEKLNDKIDGTKAKP
jgi:TolA-binding protein